MDIRKIIDNKKLKKTLLFLIPVAVVVIAAAVVVAAVFTSSPTGPRFQQSVYTEGDLQYIIVNGVTEEETTPPLVNYGFTPPEGWTLVEDSTQTANRFSTHYQDVYQNQAGESLTFSQGYAIDSQLINIQGEFQEVQFGDFTILFSCGEEEQLDGTKPKSEATWIYQNSLLTVTCQQELDVNQMLDLVNRVQYDTLREPEYTSLSFWHGQTVTDENGVTYLNEDYYEYVVEGNPDVPAVPDWFYFTQTPEGYELDPAFVGNARVEYDQDKAFEGADFIYAKNWAAYSGDNYGKVLNMDRAWTVDSRKMALTNNAYFMHCLPVRRNMIVTDEVIESPQSIVIPEAANRVVSAQTIIKEILSGLQ